MKRNLLAFDVRVKTPKSLNSRPKNRRKPIRKYNKYLIFYEMMHYKRFIK